MMAGCSTSFRCGHRIQASANRSWLTIRHGFTDSEKQLSCQHTACALDAGRRSRAQQKKPRHRPGLKFVWRGRRSILRDSRTAPSVVDASCDQVDVLTDVVDT